MLPGHNLEALQNIRLNGGRQTDVEKERERRGTKRRQENAQEHEQIRNGESIGRYPEVADGRKKDRKKAKREREREENKYRERERV